jgi:hypothetical protein
MPSQHVYEVCIHNCQERMCKPRGSSSIIWKKEGNSCKRHAMNRNVHIGCTEICPGFAFMNNPHGRHAWSRPPTDDELRAEGQSRSMDIEMSDPHHSSTRDSATPPTRESSVIDIGLSDFPTDVGSSINFTKNVFRIIYVPDPTRAVGEMQAQHDLAFVKTPVSLDEYNIIRPLGDCVHRISSGFSRVMGNYEVVVRMQEWVS